MPPPAHACSDSCPAQIRVYGMKYFDETAAYWGDSFRKIIRAGNNRLSVRSVKIFADGEPLSILIQPGAHTALARRPSFGRCSGTSSARRKM